MALLRCSLSPTPDFDCDVSAQIPVPTPRGQRVKNRDSTENHQFRSLSGPPSCYQSPPSLSPPLSFAIPTTAAIPAPDHVAPATAPLQALRARRRQNQRLQRRIQQTVNPIYLNPQFRTYREKQDQKRNEDPREQKWPAMLEDAFLDGKILRIQFLLPPTSRGTLDEFQSLTCFGIQSLASHPQHGPAKVLDEERAPRPQHAHPRIPLDRVLQVPRARRSAGRDLQADAQAGVKSYAGSEELLQALQILSVSVVCAPPRPTFNPFVRLSVRKLTKQHGRPEQTTSSSALRTQRRRETDGTESGIRRWKITN